MGLTSAELEPVMKKQASASATRGGRYETQHAGFAQLRTVAA